MSEIKGQLLGVLIVLGIFAAIGTILVTSFKSQASDLGNQMSTAQTVPAANVVIAPSGNTYVY